MSWRNWIGFLLFSFAAAAVATAVLTVLLLMLLIAPAPARDLGQWDAQSPALRAWFRGLMQPDNPLVPCCGEADAYWADSFAVDKSSGRYIAIVTDERDDAPLRRPHIAPGTRFLVPNAKIKWDRGNPTGHGVLFVGAGGVYCYVPPGGV